MSYQFGSATSLSDLLGALKTACVDGGWTVSGDVVSKGDCFVGFTLTPDYIEALVGLGSAAGVVQTPAPSAVRLRSVTTTQSLDFPVAWFSHVFDTEVYFFVRYGVDRFAYVAFGQSPVPGLPGKGVWISGYAVGTVVSGLTYNSAPPYDAVHQNGSGIMSAGPFWCVTPSSNVNSYVHHGLDGAGWSGIITGVASANRIAGYLFSAQPSAWNSEAVLLPFQVMVDRPADKRSFVAELVNARYIRINNLDPEAIITLGSDQWKVYPFYRKNAATPNGGQPLDNSGTFGWAIRYEAP